MAQLTPRQPAGTCLGQERELIMEQPVDPLAGRPYPGRQLVEDVQMTSTQWAILLEAAKVGAQYMPVIMRADILQLAAIAGTQLVNDVDTRKAQLADAIECNLLDRQYGKALAAWEAQHVDP